MQAWLKQKKTKNDKTWLEFEIIYYIMDYTRICAYICMLYVCVYFKKQNNYKRQIQNIEMAFNSQELRFSLGIHR